MKGIEIAMAGFMKATRRDPRISIAHIGVFSVLLNIRRQQGGKDPFPISREEIMESAKISSTATYFKIIRQLHEYGYIRYRPTFNRMRRSTVSVDVAVPGNT